MRKLYRQLVDDDFEPWLDKEKLLGGQNWRLEISKAVRNSDVVIVCLSADSISRSGFRHKEIKYALDVADEQPDGTIFIIPVKLDECEVPDRLRQWHWVNLFDEGGYVQLKRALEHRAASLSRIPSSTSSVVTETGSPVSETTIKSGREAKKPKLQFKGLSVQLKVLGGITLLLSVCYAILIYVNASRLRSSGPEQETASADDQLSFQQSLVEIKHNNFSAAYKTLEPLQTVKRNASLAYQAAYLRTLLALSNLNTHLSLAQSSGSALGKAADKDKFKTLAVNQSLKSFYWADQLALSLEQLTSYNVPDVSFGKIEIANPTTNNFTEGLMVSKKIESGVNPTDFQLELCQAALAGVNFRFYITKSFEPDVGNTNAMTKDVWQGNIYWSTAIVRDINESLNKVSKKGIEFFSRTSEKYLKEQGLTAEKLGLRRELGVDYFRSILQSLERFLNVMQGRHLPMVDSGEVSRMVEGVRNQINYINDKLSTAEQSK